MFHIILTCRTTLVVMRLELHVATAPVTTPNWGLPPGSASDSAARQNLAISLQGELRLFL